MTILRGDLKAEVRTSIIQGNCRVDPRCFMDSSSGYALWDTAAWSVPDSFRLENDPILADGYGT